MTDPPRTIRMHDLTAFAEKEVREKITALEKTVDALREENRRLKMDIAQYADYQEVMKLGKQIEELMWESQDRRDNA